MLKNVSIKNKLMALFIGVIIFCAGIIFFSIKQMKEISLVADKLANDRIPKLVVINDIASQVNLIARTGRNMLIFRDRAMVQEEKKELLKARDAIAKNLDALKESIRNPKGKEILAEIIVSRDEFIKSQEKFIAASDREDTDETYKILMDEFRPIQLKYMNNLAKLQDFQTILAKDEANNAVSTITESTNLISLFSIIFAALASFFGIVIVRSIVNSIHNLEKNVIEIGKDGNFDSKIEVDSKDEIGMFAFNFQEMMKAMKDMLADANMLSQAAIEGKLATRADVTKYKGDMRKIVEGVNQTLDSVIGPLNVAANYVDNISKGILPAKITDNYNGDFNTIKNNLNTCIDSLSGLISSMSEMSTQHELGDIDVKIDTAKFKGAYQEMATGINKMVFDHLNNNKRAIGIFKEYGEGNFEANLERLPGKKIFINEAIDQVRINLKALVTDAGMLAEAAIKGQLSTRADASKHKGDFRKIVDGVNKTLDAVIEPIQEASDILSKMSNGNLQARMSTNYQGDHAQISKALNTTLGMVQEKISEISRVLSSISNGNLTVKLESNYVGDFVEIKNSLMLIIESIQKIVLEIKGTTLQVTSSSGQLEGLSSNLSSGASEQAASVEESSAAIEELLASVTQNADNSKTTDKLANKSAQQAEEGGRAVLETLKAMREIAEKINVVEEIASQTNLLAVNASIESARAGEHGQGFAVVASEVRKLAEGSKKAAKDIKELTTRSLEIAENAGKLLDEIVPSIKKTANLVQEISAASEEQSYNLTSFNSTIEQLNQVAQENAASSEELAATSEILNKQANDLQNTIGFFKIDESKELEFQKNIQDSRPIASGSRFSTPSKDFTPKKAEISNKVQKLKQTSNQATIVKSNGKKDEHQDGYDLQ